jgi:peptide/nickel transport system ATP-binding protein
MLRRVLVSTAVVSKAELVIADEPTPGLHPEVLAETLQHFRQLADEGRAVVLITHDIEAALQIADQIAIFYAGTTVEIAPVNDFTAGGENLRHPYSKALWHALPQNGFEPIPGTQPLPSDLPEGCLFGPRCTLATPECCQIQPEARELRQGIVRCIHAS